VERCISDPNQAVRPASTERITVVDVQLLEHLSHGLALEAIARRMNLSERTVRRRIRRTCDELGVGTPVEAVVWAVRNGFV
jgi:DNA-binding NarL/FixJ family response regulator